MKVFVCFCVLFVAYTKGNTETECSAAEGKFIKCKFSKNINITKTDFSAYFYFENGHEELLVDCGWLGDQLNCIEQEGVSCNQPVSDFAEISVPARVAKRPGTYRCVDDGSQSENIRPCQFYDNKPEMVLNVRISATELVLLKGEKQNLTLKLKERYEMYFSFAEGTKDSQDMIYVQHRKPDSEMFYTKCVIKRSREGCTSTTNLCHCPSQPFGNYSLNKVFDEEDSGAWLFSLLVNGMVSTMTLSITVEENATKGGPESTFGSESQTSGIIVPVTVIITVLIITVIIIAVFRYYKRASDGKTSTYRLTMRKDFFVARTTHQD